MAYLAVALSCSFQEALAWAVEVPPGLFGADTAVVVEAVPHIGATIVKQVKTK